jgi:amidophosphoribosyltransferase
VEAEFIREIERGEVAVVSEKGLRTYKPFEAVRDPEPQHFCVFEHVYFARPDSLLNGRPIYQSRIEMGRQLAIEHPADAEVVVAVPDSGVPAAIGYSRQSGIPLELGLIRSHYVGRTFIEPQDSIRHFGVRLKLSPVRSVVDGKRVVVVDDSVVRGTTSRKIVEMLRNAGAREVHLRISAPPTKYPCFYGIDTPTSQELIASSHSVREIARYATCDSLAYLSHGGMMAAVGSDDSAAGYCSACFTGEYPVPLDEEAGRDGKLVKLRMSSPEN